MSIADLLRKLRENPESIPIGERHELRRLLELADADVHDLVGRNLDEARVENRRIRRQVSGLYSVAEENVPLTEFLHVLALGLMKASSLADMARVARRRVREFGIAEDFVLVSGQGVGKLASSTRLWKRLKGERCVVGGRVPMEFKPCLGRGASDVRSHVMVAIGPKARIDAFACFSSCEEKRFAVEGDFDFIRKFSELVAVRLALLPAAGIQERRAK